MDAAAAKPLSAEMHSALEWVEGRRDTLLAHIRSWASVNTHTLNVPGIRTFCELLKRDLEVLDAEVREEALPPWKTVDDSGSLREFTLGPCLVFTKRPEALRRVLLAIHTDTVFPHRPGSAPDISQRAGRLYGPGVADAKGGIAILACALEALERIHPEHLGWTLVLNSDEELGSPGSAGLLKRLAPGHSAGLIFEPALPGGAMARLRKGSGNFTLVVRGRSAHAGRNPGEGRNAVAALAGAITALHALDGQRDGLTVNCGVVRGGEAINAVPDLALVRINARITRHEDGEWFRDRLEEVRAVLEAQEGITAHWQGDFTAPPKLSTPDYARLRAQFDGCARQLGMPLEWRDTGGVCDGNRLARAGLPTVDTLGAEGGGIHTTREYCETAGLIRRAKLAALWLLKAERGDFY